MSFTSLTPNVIVRDVAASVRFYRDVLGFELEMSVPGEPPYVFAGLKRDAVRIFFNDPAAVAHDIASVARERSGRLPLAFIEVTDLEALYRAVRDKAAIVMEPKTQPYGFREFGLADPDGYVLIFAERT